MFNTHLDHVDAGDPADWPHPPYGGEVHDGLLWGRGAIDIKGPLAAQVHGVAQLVALGEPPPGDVYVTGTVQEEVGGLGARYMADTLRPDLVLIGEPSRNEVRRGHRGRVELRVQVRGRMAHASMTDIGRNPLTVLGRFLAGLEDVDLAHDPDLGTCSIAPTLIGTDQTSGNVIPGPRRSHPRLPHGHGAGRGRAPGTTAPRTPRVRDRGLKQRHPYSPNTTATATRGTR